MFIATIIVISLGMLAFAYLFPPDKDLVLGRWAVIIAIGFMVYQCNERESRRRDAFAAKYMLTNPQTAVIPFWQMDEK